MYKKTLLCFALISLSHNVSYSSEGQPITPESYKITQRPFGQAIIQGAKKGGKQALLFASPIMLVGIVRDHSASDALGFPGITGLFGAITGGFSAAISSLLPIKKEDLNRAVIRERFIVSRAGTVGAHTGTSIGTAALMACLFYHFQVR